MNKNYFMSCAIEQAKKALSCDDVPIGAVIVKDGEIIAEAHNTKEKENCSICHAEINAIFEATSKLKNWRLCDCDMYVTLEPCPMCMGAILNSRVSNLYISAKDAKAGACGSVIDLNSYPLNHKCNVEYGLYKSESLELLNKFFKKKRLK